MRFLIYENQMINICFVIYKNIKSNKVQPELSLYILTTFQQIPATNKY